MGWYFDKNTRQEVVDDLLRPFPATVDGVECDTEVIRHASIGRALYIVRVAKAKTDGRWVKGIIEVALIEKCDSGLWGSKVMDESCGPFEDNCPVEFFELVPAPNQWAKDWRERCRSKRNARTEQRAEAEDLRADIIPGRMIRLRPEFRPHGLWQVVRLGERGGIIARAQNGRDYRVPMRAVAEIVK